MRLLSRAIVCLLLSLQAASAQQFYVVPWNGGLTQMNMAIINDNGEYATVDCTKSAAADFVYGVSPFNAVDWANANQYGYPTTAENTNLTNNQGWSQNCPYPFGNRSSSVDAQVVGTSGISYEVYVRTGSAPTNVSAGCTSTSTSSYGGAGYLINGPNCSFTFTPTNNNGAINYSIAQVGDNNLQNFQIYPATINGISSATLLAQSPYAFAPDFLAALGQPGIGMIRFMDVMSTTDGATALFEDTTPTTWYCYTCSYYPRSIITANQPTLVSGAEYTVNCANTEQCYGMTSLSDKAHIIAQFPANANVITGTATGSTGSTVINFSSVPSGIVAGMAVQDSGSGSIAKNARVVSTTTSTVTLNCGNANASCTPIISAVQNGDTISFSQMLNVNGTGYYPVMFTNGALLDVPAQWQTLTWDQTIGSGTWVAQYQAGTSSGFQPNWPYAMMVGLANQLHVYPYFNLPYFAFDGNGSGTEYLTKAAQFVKTNLDSHLTPWWSGPDEVWNYIFDSTTYADIKTQYLTGGNTNHDYWYGARMAALGPTLVSVLGSGKFGFVAEMSGGDDGGFPVKGSGEQDQKLSVNNAYQYVTHVSIAPYTQSAFWNTDWEVGWAYCYVNGGVSCPSQSTLIGDFLAGLTVAVGTSGFANVTWNNLNMYPAFFNYVSSYSSLATIGVTQYEGGYASGGGGLSWGSNATDPVISVATGSTTTVTVEPSFSGYISGNTLTVTTAPSSGAIAQFMAIKCSGCSANTTVLSGSGTSWQVTPSQTTGSSGSPKSMTGDNAMDYLYNTAGLSGLTMTVSGVCAALNGDQTVTATTATTITLNVNTIGGCSYTSGGTLAYDSSGTGGHQAGAAGYLQQFELAAQLSSQLTPYVLQDLQNFHTQGGVFPSMFDLSDSGYWAKYWVNIFSSTNPQISAVNQFQQSP